MAAHHKETEEKKSKVPHIFVILFGLMVIAYILSFLIPQGAFNREINAEGTEVIVPGTFSFTEEGPASFFQLLLAIPNGLIETAEIIFGILMIGGMFAVIEKAGLIQLGVNKLGNLFKDKSVLIIPTLMIPFALFTTFTAQVELSLIYLPTILPLMLRLGYDRIAAAGTVLIATIAGFTIGLTTPANLGVAQEISGLPLYSGLAYRIIILAIILLIGIFHVIRYANKIKGDPSKSLMYDEGFTSQDRPVFKVLKATPRQLAASIVLLVAIAILIYGLIEHQWYFKELSGLYIITGIIIGLITGLRPTEISESFLDGFKQILLGAMIVGVARGVALVLNDGNIMDTIIYGTNIIIESVPGSVTAVVMMFVQAGLNFLIPSGSGQAMVTMPIMSGLADLSDITRQTSVLAFLMGDGFTNIIFPTSGYFMATLALARVKWEKWVKFILPLIIIWYIAGAIFLVIAQVIAYGPF
mgnify:CR=1 FL=1